MPAPYDKLESPESSSPIITRAVAAGLQGEYCVNYPTPGWQRVGLKAIGFLPERIGRPLISRLAPLAGIPPNRLEHLSIDDLIKERMNDYATLGPRRFPAVLLGAGLSGPATHLSLSLGGLFLPQAFVMTINGGSPQGSAHRQLERSREIAARIVRQNPSVLAIQHYDPVHDGWMTRFVNHLRLKLIDLPQVYKDFIHSRLEPGGAVCYLDCGAQWLRYRIGERHIFQVGGWGDLSPQEFLEGSERVRRYCAQTGLQCDWTLEGYPLENGPESEWGSEPGLGEALERFCQAEGYRFIDLRFPHPEDYSVLAFRAVERNLQKEGRQPTGVLVEMFSQFDGNAVRQSGLLPLWLIFNTWDSLRFLQRMTSAFPEDKPLFFSPLITFSITPDMVPYVEWQAALRQFDLRNVGARLSHYPGDALRLTNWYEPLRAWTKEHGRPIRTHLQPGDLSELASQIRQDRREL